MKRGALFAAISLLVSGVFAAPQLKSQPETIASEGIKLKVLNNSAQLPAPSLQLQTFTRTQGGVSETVQFYKARDLWHKESLIATWKDRRDNMMSLYRVDSLPPKGVSTPYGEMIEKEKATEAMAKARAEFSGDIYAWECEFHPAKTSKTFTAKNGKIYHISFIIREDIRWGDKEKLLKAAVGSLTPASGNPASAYSTMKWWAEETEKYKFLTDLDKSRGGRFVKDSSRLAEAMRNAYEFYVPAHRKVGKCTVRVFKTLSGYRDYRASTGDEDKMSCGLWDPSREELLIAAEDKEQAQNTMRHEGFHQYLHYATGRGDHAMWFNEGHAAFFEYVKYNAAKNSVKVIDKGNRATWVEKNPALHARHMKNILRYSHQDYYSGDVNLNYCTGWALIYFLQKGAYAAEEFKDYRSVVPTYLEAMNEGASAAEATRRAFKAVEDRDLEQDFLRFWAKYRKSALNAH